MKKSAAMFAVVGAAWMIGVLYSGSLLVATVSDYPGVFAARWVQSRGIAPSLAMIWGFNIWLVLTSAIEWIAAGLVLREIVRHRAK
jgi:hypothetical protein